jgi:hypothetical protein
MTICLLIFFFESKFQVDLTFFFFFALALKGSKYNVGHIDLLSRGSGKDF